MSTKEYARKILKAEAQAIEGLDALLDDHFIEAVEKICALPNGGRVIVCGMGKAGFIAMKLSATFSSLGIPSFYLHPAEALHGDLGRFTRNDIAIVLSNSGETPEIIQMIPTIKRIGTPLISITSINTSALAQYSDIIIQFGKLEEVGPLGLAPTTSTTAMLALGDALAMSVINAKGISPEQFAMFHPGGNLGRSLTLVKQLMRTGERHCTVPPDMKTRDVIHAISSAKGRPGAATVLDSSGRLIGIFTDGNLRRCLEEKREFLDLPISQLATQNPKVIRENALAQEALRIMGDHQIDQLIVVNDEDHVTGLIDIQDLV